MSRPASGRSSPAKQAQERRLAGAVGADQAGDAAGSTQALKLSMAGAAVAANRLVSPSATIRAWSVITPLRRGARASDREAAPRASGPLAGARSKATVTGMPWRRPPSGLSTSTRRR